MSDPTFNQSPRTSRLLRLRAATDPTLSSVTTGATRAQRTASQIATGMRKPEEVRSDTMRTAITTAPSTGARLENAIR